MNTKTKQRISGSKVFDILSTVSPAVKIDNMIFCSGQVAIEPETGQLMNSSLEDEVHQVMKNICAILNAADCTLDDIVKTTIFLTSMNDFPKVNEIYGSYFKGIAPARSTVAVAGLYKNLKVEIETIAVPGSGHKK